MKQQELSVLSNVIAVARRELADREDKEIPSQMRMVAKRGGRRLPPPFQVSVVKELRRSDAFRASVLERWEAEGIDDAIGLAFLTDPDTAIEQVAEQAGTHDIALLEADLHKAEKLIRSLEDQVAEAKVRLTDAAKDQAAEISRRDAAAVASRASLDKAVRTLTVRVAELEAAQDDHAGVVSGLAAEIDALEGKVERSNARARKRAHKRHVKVPRPMSPPSEPIALAAWLDMVDRQQRTFRKASDTAVTDAAPDHPPLRIPGGLHPDSPEALIALIEQKPDVIYVDGYNVGAMFTDDFGTSRARSTVMAVADRLALVSQARVVVVFDAVGVDGRSGTSIKGRAEILFALTQIADDEIVDLVRAEPSRAAVITSDRELSNRCEDEGCVTVWSEALVRWARQ